MTSITKAFIMAAGGGTRMRPLTANMPKPMLPVGGKPILKWTLDTISDLGIEEVFILIGWRSREIREHFRDGNGLKIHYLHQDERLGTAHAVGIAREGIDEPFLCLSGDVLLGKDGVGKLLDTYEKRGTNVMGLAKVEDPTRYGVVSVEGGMVSNILEKPESTKIDTVNAGSYVFTPSIFNYIDRTELSKRGEYELTDSLSMIAEEGGLCAAMLEDEWHDVARPWDLLTVNDWILSKSETRIDGTVEEGVTYSGPLIVEEGAIVKSGTYIEGAVHIGKGAVVGPNSYLRGSTSLGEGSKVGAASEVKNSIIMNGSNIPHHNYVGDSIIGRGCNLGSGTKIANLRLDDRAIRVKTNEGSVDSGLRKLGAIIGDNVKTGVNASIDCGTVIGHDTYVGPGRRVSGLIAPGSKIL